MINSKNYNIIFSNTRCQHI